MRIYFGGFVAFFFSFHNDKKNTNEGILPRKTKSASEKQLNYLNLHIDHKEENLRGQTKQYHMLTSSFGLLMLQPHMMYIK